MHALEHEPEHALHVARLALRIFDELESWHCLASMDRVLLEAAACLHDIGWATALDGRGHHKHSARLIRAQAWQHFPPEEVNFIALVARYHRRSVPKPEHTDFAMLPETDRGRVQKMAAMLRIADALDRRHLQIVSDLRIELGSDEVLFSLVSRRPPAAEIEACRKKGDLLEDLTGRKLVWSDGTA
jgi:exopolyphosphatase / guanosine-5'-triphosphate,3'-diphosphate pyrophosphatase